MWIKFLIDLLSKLSGSKGAKENQKPPEPSRSNQEIPPSSSELPKTTMPSIDWSNPKSKISKYFTVEEAIFLREWNRLTVSADGLNDHVKAQLVRIFTEVMDPIRELIAKPIFIKSAYRPKAYNVAIGGAQFSAHMCTADYAAVDWWTDANGDGQKDGKDCDDLKKLLMPKLESMQIRMEDNGAGAKWVHVDNRPVPNGGNRFFKP